MSAQPAHDAFGLPPGVLPRILAVLRTWPQVGTVTLFGSRALGTFRTGSDIDLCVTAPDLGLTELLQIENQIDDLLLPWKIDLLLRHQIDNPDLLAHIDHVGVEL